MFRPKLLLCAEGVVIDRMSNNASAFNILEQLNFHSLPVVFPKMVIFSLMERDEGDPDKWNGEIHISLAGLDILNQRLEHDFQGLSRSRNLLTIGGLPITQPGTMKICLCQEGREIISYTVEVTVPQKPTVSQST
jgi:hypothetical protein